MPAVAILDSDFPELDLESRQITAAGLTFIDPGDVTEGSAPGVKGLVVQWVRVDGALLDRFPDVEVVGRYGVGVDSIDMTEAAQRNIRVVTSGDYATEEVSIHAITLALALLRHLRAADEATRRGAWIDFPAWREARRLSELTVGVVGLGRIGRRVAGAFAALGARVVGFDPAVAAPDVETVEAIEDLLERSDIVTLHVPLAPGAPPLLDVAAIARMRSGAILVNTARGGLVDTDALVDALVRGHLGGAGLDVFETEPLPAGHPLTALPDVILTPHIGYYSVEALLEARRRTIAGVIDVIQGREPLYPAVGPVTGTS